MKKENFISIDYVTKSGNVTKSKKFNSMTQKAQLFYAELLKSLKDGDQVQILEWSDKTNYKVIDAVQNSLGGKLIKRK